MSELMDANVARAGSTVIEKDEYNNLNRQKHFLEILESISSKIQNFYTQNSFDLTNFFQFVVTQIYEALEIDRVEIVQVSVNGGQKSRAQIGNLDKSINSHLNLPIIVHLQKWGYILLESCQSKFKLINNELSFLNQLNLYIAIAVQQKQLKQQWQQEIVRRKEVESALKEFVIDSEKIPSCDPIVKLKLQEQVSNLQLQKRKLEDKNTMSKLLTDLTCKIRNSLNLEEILVTTVSEIHNSLNLDRIVIYKILPEGSGKIITESLTPGYPSVLGFVFPEETLPISCQHRLGRQAYKAVADIQAEYQANYPCLVEFLEGWCVKSKALVPIIYDTKVWGFLIVHQCSYCRQWTELEIELLCQLSNQLAVAIKQSELYHQLEAKLQEEQKTQNELQNSLKEKEILLKEIHHRVKNNLNIISSMLNLQTDKIEDQQIINMFSDSQNRIRSIALIHEQLYNSTNLSQIDFAKYIQSLIQNLCNIHNNQNNGIHLEMNLMPYELNLETAIPCGLLLNEIITNSFKHAFKERDRGQIEVSFSFDGVFCHLIISDNGVGIPKDFDLENSTSLGLRLVNLLTMQLNAKLEVDSSSQGTFFKLSFTELEYEKRI